VLNILIYIVAPVKPKPLWNNETFGLTILQLNGSYYVLSSNYGIYRYCSTYKVDNFSKLPRLSIKTFGTFGEANCNATTPPP